MTEYHIIPDKWKVFSGSTLKVIATVSMFIDHAGSYLVDKNIVLLQLGTHKLLLYRLMRDLGASFDTASVSRRWRSFRKSRSTSCIRERCFSAGRMSFSR